VLKECLVFSSMRLGVPFIAPRQQGAVESNPRRQFLPSVAWRTGHCPVRISFLLWRSRPLAALAPLAHRTLSGAHRTVWCPLPTVGSTTCPARIAQPTVGPADRWLTGQSGAHRTVRCTPDSPVNYSRTPLIYSRERQVRLSQPGAPDTVRCTTGQSGAPRQSWLWLNKAISTPIQFLLFPALRHNTLVTKTMY
jgi:hypothetical protein